jgi:excisionase family DNA binding protein
MPGKSNKFARRHELAELLGCHVCTVDRQIKNGSIPSVKIGNRVLIPRSFIDELDQLAAGGAR